MKENTLNNFDELLCDFHVLLEETRRRHLAPNKNLKNNDNENNNTNLTSSSSPMKAIHEKNKNDSIDIVACHHALLQIYDLVQRLFDCIPMDSTFESQSQSQSQPINNNNNNINNININNNINNNNANVHLAMVENCYQKAFCMALDLFHLVATGRKRTRRTTKLSDNKTNNNSHNINNNINNNHDSLPESTKIATAESAGNGENVPDGDLQVQSSIANMMEITFKLCFHDRKGGGVTMNDHHPSTTTDNNSMEYRMILQEAKDIVNVYVEYQRKVLRNRCKPSIANVAKIRREAKRRNITVGAILSEIVFTTHSGSGSSDQNDHHDDDIIEEEEEEAENGESSSSQQEKEHAEERRRRISQPHAYALTAILAETSSLIHPLALWRDSLYHHDNDTNLVMQHLHQVCVQSIHTLDKEAQTLAVTVGNWFLEDRKVDLNLNHNYNNNYNNNNNNNNKYENNHNNNHNNTPPPPSSLLLEHRDNDKIISNHNTNTTTTNPELMDHTLEEMAYICQVIQRYCSFIDQIILITTEHDDTTHNNNNDISDANGKKELELHHHLQELSLQYSTAETSLMTIKFQRALHLASPIEIVLGTGRLIPSVVEDAHFISTKGVERAGGTMCDKALWSVSNWVSQLWHTENNHDNNNIHNVYISLMQQKGCFLDIETYSSKNSSSTSNNVNNDSQSLSSSSSPNNTDNNNNNNNTRNNFKNALLDAIDDDIEAKNQSSDGHLNRSNQISSAPSSGSSLSISMAFGMATAKGKNLIQKSNFTVDDTRRKMDALLCTLNGIHAASSSCTELASLFLSLLSFDIYNDENNDDDTKDDDNNHHHHRLSCNNDKSTFESIQLEKIDDAAITTSDRMILMTRDELLSHSKSFASFLNEQVHLSIGEWCGTVTNTSSIPPFVASLPSAPALHRLFYYISTQRYNFENGGEEFCLAESDERLDAELLNPISDCRIFQEVASGKCDAGVTFAFASTLSSNIVDIIMGTLLGQRKPFTEWGSLLLSKQVRVLQDSLCSLILHANDDNAFNGTGTTINDVNQINTESVGEMRNTSEILDRFHRLTQAATILQLEKPSDWSAFAYDVRGHLPGSNLSTDEIHKIMMLRVDFSEDAVNAVCSHLP